MDVRRPSTYPSEESRNDAACPQPAVVLPDPRRPRAARGPPASSDPHRGRSRAIGLPDGDRDALHTELRHALQHRRVDGQQPHHHRLVDDRDRRRRARQRAVCGRYRQQQHRRHLQLRVGRRHRAGLRRAAERQSRSGHRGAVHQQHRRHRHVADDHLHRRAVAPRHGRPAPTGSTSSTAWTPRR